MYQHKPAEFLAWYYHRFSTYRDYGPNEVHYWLADKNLITQNIDGLDGKAGNKNYIAIHGRLDQMTLFHTQGNDVETFQTPWNNVDPKNLEDSLLDLFNINKQKQQPIINESFKPFILLFDEFYTELYRINEAQQRMKSATRIIFIGTSFSVNITQIALQIAMQKNIPIEIVDPDPVRIDYENIKYHQMKASEYINALTK